MSSAGGGLHEEGLEELGQEEVAEMVGAELHVVAVLSLPVGAHHHACREQRAHLKRR